jgi:hypothetical protein
VLGVVLVTSALLCLSCLFAGQTVVAAGADDDEERQRLAAAVLAMPPERVAQLRSEVDRQARLARMHGSGGGGVLAGTVKPTNGIAPTGRWGMHRAPDGRRYYVNADDGSTTWETPAELREFKKWDHRKGAANAAIREFE